MIKNIEPIKHWIVSVKPKSTEQRKDSSIPIP